MKKLLNSLLKIPEIRGNWIIRTTSKLNTHNEETMMDTAVRPHLHKANVYYRLGTTGSILTG